MRPTPVDDVARVHLIQACWALLDALDMPSGTAKDIQEKFIRVQFCRAQLKELLGLIEKLTLFRVYRGPPL